MVTTIGEKSGSQNVSLTNQLEDYNIHQYVHKKYHIPQNSGGEKT